MPQPLRIEYPGAWLHVFIRAAWGRTIFVDDADRRFFLKRLARVVERYGWRCTGYCLMTTHYHLNVLLTRPNLAFGMQELNSYYARAFNGRHGRHGHVFSERYESLLTETESYVLQAHRYVALNPVDAGLCDRPENWPWSSCRATAGLAPRPPFLDVDPLLALWSPDPVQACAAYRAFVDEAASSGTSQIVASGGSVTVAA